MMSGFGTIGAVAAVVTEANFAGLVEISSIGGADLWRNRCSLAASVVDSTCVVFTVSLAVPGHCFRCC